MKKRNSQSQRDPKSISNNIINELTDSNINPPKEIDLNIVESSNNPNLGKELNESNQVNKFPISSHCDFNNSKNENMNSSKKKKNEEISNNNRSLMKFKNLNDSDSEFSDFEERKNFVFCAKSKLKYFWDIVILFLISYSIVITPFLFVFRDLGTVFYFDLFLEILLYVDIVLNFMTPIYSINGKIINDSRKIKKRYMKIYFKVDLISSFPLNLTIYSINLFLAEFNFRDTSNFILFYLIIKWISILRITKFFDNTKGRPLSNFGNCLINDLKYEMIFKSSIIFLLFVHYSSCFWIFIGNIKLAEGTNWINSNNLTDKSFFEIYIASFYFHLVTIYTIGYGDIIATNNLERIYNNLLLIMYDRTNMYSHDCNVF